MKFRESFRPTPSVLFSEVNNWFDFEKDSPYMTFVANVKDKRRLMTDEEKNFLELKS